MGTVVSLNGAILEPDQAKISVFDRGFLYGDSVYEVMRTYQGVPFEEARHWTRLESSAARIGMGLPVDPATLSKETALAHRATGNTESYLRIVCTRGSGPIGLDPGLAVDPVRLVIAQPVTAPSAQVLEEGVTIALVSVRKNLKTAIDPLAKTGNYLNSVLAVGEAKKRGAYEAILLDHQGAVTEGASSNVFVVRDGAVLTPPIGAGILAGVTRAVLFELAQANGVDVKEEMLEVDQLLDADEVFITSSIREIVPVTQVDDKKIGTGKPGPIYRRLRQAFDAYVEEYTENMLKAAGRSWGAGPDPSGRSTPPR